MVGERGEKDTTAVLLSEEVCVQQTLQGHLIVLKLAFTLGRKYVQGSVDSTTSGWLADSIANARLQPANGIPLSRTTSIAMKVFVVDPSFTKSFVLANDSFGGLSLLG